ncbi:MAG: hypothetical protein JWO87_3866 [Phycisphaerales bacterium]|jgi:hypothetical protein|nr:hypothetical protein [Phycisphaerales bacterium]MDB5302203.1 hypothetical protein [Phycisphaerales bacterium]MDB5305745.1 hypothetical protein [Phycisphaerales bacterium]
MHFQQWLQQGEALYQNALKEFHAIEAQLDDLETRLVAKQAEVNQIAQVIGKPPAEGNRRLSAQLVTGQIIDDHERQPQPVTNNANIARALTGKFGR